MMMIKLSFVTAAVAILNLFGNEGGNINTSLEDAILTDEQLEARDAEAATPVEVSTPEPEADVIPEVEEVVQEIPADDNVEQGDEGDEEPSAVAEEVTAASISCGSHTASTCGECLVDAIANTDITNKEGFCNGVCVYNHESEACVASAERVNCGHHQAASCEECTTEDKGERYCHGDCKWSEENKCESN